MLNDRQISRLLDIANAGCHKGLVEEARTIYQGILALHPGHIPALIGQALSHIVIGEFSQAEGMLRSLREQHPEDTDVTAVLGLCLFLADKKDEARELLESISQNGNSSSALAASLMEQMD
jgi:thioredoxin-like negative regulator of GroEL